jgi:threonylcarbamoyladenosine tRNA methylthiotransferase MtaB
MQLKNKSFCVVTLGCRVNQYESNDIACQLINRQAIKIDKISKAEICVFNTCCVTHKAETKCKNLINRAIKSTTCKLIIIVGCYSQLIKSFNSKKIRIVLGTKYKNILGEALDKLQDQEKVIQIDNHKKNELFE